MIMQARGGGTCDPIEPKEIVAIMNSRAGDARLRKAAQDLLDYRKRAGPLNFQLEKADHYLREIRLALEGDISEPPLSG